MNIQNVESNAKRPKDAPESEQNKRMRPETPEELNASLNITNLDTDCLEHIFKKLDIGDLLNVANSTKCFEQAVDLVYANKYGNMTVHIFRGKPEERPIDAKLGGISVHDLLSSLRLLRCFGHLISKLHSTYFYRQSAKIYQYINEYCTESLNEIDLHSAPEEVMGLLTEPFPKVEDVTIIGGHLDRDTMDLNILFPNMRRLHISSDSKFGDFFPHLEHLTTCTPFFDDISIQSANVAEVFCLHPQIRNLISTTPFMHPLYLQEQNEHLQHLESLYIKNECFFSKEFGVVHLRNLEHFNLDYLYGCMDLCGEYHNSNTRCVGHRAFAKQPVLRERI